MRVSRLEVTSRSCSTARSTSENRLLEALTRSMAILSMAALECGKAVVALERPRRVALPVVYDEFPEPTRCVYGDEGESVLESVAERREMTRNAGKAAGVRAVHGRCWSPRVDMLSRALGRRTCSQVEVGGVRTSEPWMITLGEG